MCVEIESAAINHRHMYTCYKVRFHLTIDFKLSGFEEATA